MSNVDQVNARRVDVSVIVPVYNEKESLPLLCEELTSVLSNLKKSYEIILIDDGCDDGTFDILPSAVSDDSNIKILRFNRNFGQTAALAAGFDHAQGQIIIPIDADLQNDPNDIPSLLLKLEEGYDVVSGWRKNRKDRLFTRKIPSFIANRIISFLVKMRLHDYGCTLKAYRREIAKSLSLHGEMHRYLPVIAQWKGAKVIEIEVNHRPRQFGKAKYGLGRTFKVILDLVALIFLFNYSSKPMYFFGALGFICFVLSFISGTALVIRKVFFGFYLIASPLLLLTVFLVIIGIMFVFLGLLAELIIRLYYETLDKKIYTLKD